MCFHRFKGVKQKWWTPPHACNRHFSKSSDPVLDTHTKKWSWSRENYPRRCVCVAVLKKTCTVHEVFGHFALRLCQQKTVWSSVNVNLRCLQTLFERNTFVLVNSFLSGVFGCGITPFKTPETMQIRWKEGKCFAVIYFSEETHTGKAGARGKVHKGLAIWASTQSNGRWRGNVINEMTTMTWVAQPENNATETWPAGVCYFGPTTSLNYHLKKLWRTLDLTFTLAATLAGKLFELFGNND